MAVNYVRDPQGEMVLVDRPDILRPDDSDSVPSIYKSNLSLKKQKFMNHFTTNQNIMVEKQVYSKLD